MPIPDSYKPLVLSLSGQTQKGKVNWKSTPDDKAFVVYFKEFAFTLRWDWDRNEGETVYAAILNAEGREIDSLAVQDGDPDFPVLSNLHAAARRKALRIDDALSTIMAELKTDLQVGEDPPPPAATNNEPDDDLPF
jgi:hypothetical protein